jgi:hypothetical protein
MIVEATPHALGWVHDVLPRAARLFHNDRFQRALSIFDDSNWSPRLEIAATLIWTSMEILFDKSASRHKTKEVSSALSDFVAHSPEDRDRAYTIIRDLLIKRGQVVHVGSRIDRNDFGQTHKIARAAFLNVLTYDKLPPAQEKENEPDFSP